MLGYSVWDTYKAKDIHQRIMDVYRGDARPWVVGFSGGKDSTAVVQLIFNAMRNLPPDERTKPIHVISTDTLVETPLIIDYIAKTLTNIERAARECGLPITVHKLRPKAEDSFWSTLIGKGYPAPRQKFRWCTDRLKIQPANRFIYEKVSQFGEVVVVLGVRMKESASRDQVMNKLKIAGKALMKHTSMVNAFVYAPIEDFSTDDVWTYLLQVPSPWGNDNHELFQLYKDSNAGECPLVVDTETPSCGNSRFGCWTCTVVQEDKAIRGFIESGAVWLQPLLDYRDWLYRIRDDHSLRDKKRRNGAIYYIGEGSNRRLGPGPFTLDARVELLKRLFQTQKALGVKLISLDELRFIRQLWIADGDWQDRLPTLYVESLGEQYPDKAFDERPMVPTGYDHLLAELCNTHDVPLDVVKKLVGLEFEHYGYKLRIGLMNKIGRTLREDWLHKDIREELEGVPEGATE